VWFFFFGARRTRTHLNTTVRGTVACRRLDGGNTIIFPQGGKMQLESISLHHT